MSITGHPWQISYTEDLWPTRRTDLQAGYQVEIDAQFKAQLIALTEFSVQVQMQWPVASRRQRVFH
jgi:hypothetical protein